MSWCSLGLKVVVAWFHFMFLVKIWTLFILIAQILISVLLTPSPSVSSLSSYSAGGASVCHSRNSLACPVLSAMLWCHCQKLGFGWVTEDFKGNREWIFEIISLCMWFLCFNVLICSSGIVACNWLVIFSVCITLMCTFDPTGRTFVKLKATRRRQRNLTTYTLR